MRKTQASQTAMGTAAVRAIEAEKPADERICYDPLARKFISSWFYFQVRLFARISEWFTHGGSSFVVWRSRYIDDYLQECRKTGTTQVVILGAGLDSRAYRDGLLAGAVTTFEVDYPATQASKIERVKKLFDKLPENVVYAPIDFNIETLDKLLAFGFDRSLKTLFIWEGVTIYLDGGTIEATLTWVRTNAAPGSSIIFDYQDTSTLTRRNIAYRVLNQLTGEKRVFGIQKEQMETLLTRKGFSHLVNVTAEQLKFLYCKGPNQRRPVAKYYSIVHAEVGCQ